MLQITVYLIDALQLHCPMVRSCLYNIIHPIYIYSALQVSENQGFAGTMVYQHPILNAEEFNTSDANFRRACCEIGFDDGYYCGKYFQQRIVNNCRQPEAYTAPVLGMCIQ